MTRDHDHRVEEVDGEAVIGHEPGEPPARVQMLPEYDDDAEADRDAEEGLPEGAGGALPGEGPAIRGLSSSWRRPYGDGAGEDMEAVFQRAPFSSTANFFMSRNRTAPREMASASSITSLLSKIGPSRTNV